MDTSSAAIIENADCSDEDVIRQVLNGNTAIFELLMRRYNERVYRAVRGIIRDEQEAEDVMQQVYVNAFAHLRQFSGAARFSTWLTRIAINEALARVRRHSRFEPFDETLPEIAPLRHGGASDNPEWQAFTGELRGLLEWAIDSLSDGMREVVVLRDVEGMSTAEVADVLGLSEEAVKTRLSRGRAALRRALLTRTGASASDAFRFHRPRCDRIVATVLARLVGVRPGSEYEYGSTQLPETNGSQKLQARSSISPAAVPSRRSGVIQNDLE